MSPTSYQAALPRNMWASVGRTRSKGHTAQVTGPAQRFYQPVQLLPRNAAGVPVINLELALDRNN